MKQSILIVIIAVFSIPLFAQKNSNQEVSPDPTGIKSISGNDFINGKKCFTTRIKDQERTSTCWSFSTTSLLESQAIKNSIGGFDLSEMFTVRNIYIEKAHNYILRQGHAQFSEGALGHDVIRSYDNYGGVPENIYNGLSNGEKVYDHEILFKELKKYVDSVAKSKQQPLSADWIPGYTHILDKFMGTVPEKFIYNGKYYTPKEFAKNALKFNPEDYVNITSFTHHPFYKPFVIEVPDNFSNGAYYNLPINEMIELAENALNNGFSILWDTDVSNKGFNSKKGIAINIANNQSDINPESIEENWNETIRQNLFENLATQDDHLMHIVGIEKNKSGKTFFIVKNSWGEVGPYNGFIHVSSAYFAINTISLIVPKAAIKKSLLDKLNISQ
jgi:bleomycin hydrolase